MPQEILDEIFVLYEKKDGAPNSEEDLQLLHFKTKKL